MHAPIPRYAKKQMHVAPSFLTPPRRRMRGSSSATNYERRALWLAWFAHTRMMAKHPKADNVDALTQKLEEFAIADWNNAKAGFCTT